MVNASEALCQASKGGVASVGKIQAFIKEWLKEVCAEAQVVAAGV